MKKIKSANIKALFIVLATITLTSSMTFLPWWSFILPVILVAIIISNRKWQVSFFWIGFLSGFILWAGANLYFDLQYPGDVLTNLGLLLSVPKIVVFIISGIIGGLLTGLAFYTGKNIFSPYTEISSEDRIVK